MSLSVIIPSRTRANVEPCIAAVRCNEPDARIFIVDDSVDWAGIERECVPDGETAEGYRKVRPAWMLISGLKPFIYARNCNLGIHAAGTDDVILLNDDALLETPGGFTAMRHTAQEHPEYGLIASTCNNVGNRNQWRTGNGELRAEGRMVCFVCVLIPRRTIDLVGLLDENFTGYGCEDDDYCLRVRKAGLMIGIHDGCYVDHGSLTSSFRGPAGAGGNYLPNLEIFKRKWGMDNWGNPA